MYFIFFCEPHNIFNIFFLIVFHMVPFSDFSISCKNSNSCVLSFTHIIPLLCFSHLSSTILSIKELTNIDIVFSSNHPQMGNSIINNKILRTILLIHIITTIKHNKYNKIYAIRLPTKYHMPLSLIIYLQSDLPQVKLQIFCCFSTSP